MCVCVEIERRRISICCYFSSKLSARADVRKNFRIAAAVHGWMATKAFNILFVVLKIYVPR